MPNPAPSFNNSKKNRRRRRQKLKMKNRQRAQLHPKQPIEVLENPMKSEIDKKDYKHILLPNGLRALLISDMNYESLEDDSDESSDEDSDGGSSGPMESSSDNEVEESNEGEESDNEDTVKKNVFTENEKMAACGLCVGVGSYSDPPEIPGLAHFVEHMVFMGSKKYPKENSFDSFIKKNGGNNNASTECETTIFHLEVPEEQLLRAMDMLSQFFISPLMKQEAMQREKESIQSEFAEAIPSDRNRRDQLLAGLLPEGHPARSFMWGNTLSLSRPGDAELHAAAHAFRKHHYSAHRMTLAVQARLPLAKLEKLTLKTFGMVPNNGIPPPDFSAHNLEPEDVTPDFRCLYYVKPYNHVTELHLTWCLRSLLKDYQSKPDDYLGWIIGHEGPGSLISYLRKKFWALNIYAGTSVSGIDHASTHCFFIITLELTTEGLGHIEEVVEAAFSYINMLRRNCPNERIFKEVKSFEDMSMMFEQESDAYDNVESLVENMHMFQHPHIITGPQLYFQYVPEDIEYVLNSLKPDYINIMVISDQHTEPILYDQKEEWFGTEYLKNEISLDTIEKWRSAEPYQEFHLPNPNIYLVDNFQLIPLPQKLTNLVGKEDKKNETPHEAFERKKAVKAILNVHPTLEMNDGLVELWYKPDYKFRRPNALVYISLASPIISRSPKDTCLMEIWREVLYQLLMESLYAAFVAGYWYRLELDEKGMVIKVSGYNQNITVLVDVITSTMRDYLQYISEELFEGSRETLSMRYRNLSNKGSKFIREMRFSAVLLGYWNSAQKLEALARVTYQDLRDIGATFMRRMVAQVLVQGNVLREESFTIVRIIRTNLAWETLPIPDRRKMLTFELPLGERYLRTASSNPLEGNSSVCNYYQFGLYSIAESCYTQLLIMLLEEPLFDTLRTKEQLGYHISCLQRISCGILGFSISVDTQAQKYSAEYVDFRIDRFLDTFGRALLAMPHKKMEKARKSLLKVMNSAHLELKSEMSRHWEEIYSNDYLFNRIELEIDYLTKLKFEELQVWFWQRLHPSGKQYRKLCLQVIGTNLVPVNAQFPEKPELDEVIHDPNYLMNLRRVPDTLVNKVYITNLNEFKSSMLLFPDNKDPFLISLSVMVALHSEMQKKGCNRV